MKKITRVLVLLSMVWMFALENSQAQIVVRVRPRRPGMIVFHQPHRPSPRHIWVGEEWTPSGTTYVYHRGYWALPPRPGTIWIAGHWDHRGRGYFWIPGHWR